MFRALQEAGAAALGNSKEWHSERNSVYHGRLEAAEALLRALGCTWDNRQEGLFLWGRLPAGSPDAGAVIDDLLYHRHIFLAPGFIFGEKGKRYVRISLCTPKERIWEAVERITGNDK